MQHYEIPPPLVLQSSIRCLWYSKLDFGKTSSIFEIMPDGYVEIIFLFGSACSISTGGRWQPLPSPALLGLLRQPALLQATNHLEVIGIRCFPWVVPGLLDLPLTVTPVRGVPPALSALQATLAPLVQAGQLTKALAQVAHHCLTAWPEVVSDQVLARAGTALRQASGTLPVGQVAAAAYTTVRTLERRFKQAAGYTVKEVAALMRFEQVRNHLWRHPGAQLAGLARQFGYADQAHLSRDFKRYSGTTPTAFGQKPNPLADQP